MEAALKFFLGNDATSADNDDSDDEDKDDDDVPVTNKDVASIALDKELVYKVGLRRHCPTDSRAALCCGGRRADYPVQCELPTQSAF